ncbi:MAG: TIGR00645 family protein [Paracoccaceae bacterium]
MPPEITPAPHRKPTIETRFEQGLFGARWLLAPMYLGLVLALGMLTVIFLKELAHYLPMTLTMEADKGILAILTLIDLTLAANLMLIVLFSGYENFVSKLDIAHTEDRPDWMGKVDFSGLKMKLIASIVAISGIHLLKVFMEIGKTGAEHPVPVNLLMWMVIIHLTFVVSGVLLALMDWLSAKTDKH